MNGIFLDNNIKSMFEMSSNGITRKLGLAIFCVTCAFIYLLLFSTTLSPLYSVEACDSSMFKLMGQVIIRGKLPYVDMFEHKGPMLYCLQALGQWLIPGRNGLFVLAIAALSISIVCWYKSARFFTTPIKSIIVICLTLFTYYLYTDSGNLAEDWNIPFISLSYYLILMLLFDKTGNFLIHGSIVGLCLACSFFIRPNDAVALIGAPIFGIVLWLLNERKYQTIAKWVGGIIIGFSAITSVFIIWFAANNALWDFWYGVIGFNAKYTTGISGLITGCFRFDKLGYIPFLVALFILCRQHKEGRLMYIQIPTIIAAYILLGGNVYQHYWIVWIPILFFSYWLLAVAQSNKALTIMAICLFVSLPMFSNRDWVKNRIMIYNQIQRDVHYVDPAEVYSKVLFDSIPQEDQDSIWSYNLTWKTKDVSKPSNAFNVLLYNEIIPCNRVPLIFMAEKDSALLDYMDITKEAPKYILFSQQHTVPQSYALCDSMYIESNYNVKKICNELHIILYQRKEDHPNLADGM